MNSEHAAASFAALGQPTRLDLLRRLLAAGEHGVIAGDLATQLGVPASTLSFHLRALEQAGLITPTRRGRFLVYAPEMGAVRALVMLLGGLCLGEDPARHAALDRLLQPVRPAMPPAVRVLFLCTHNAARSIMAEALLNVIGEGRFVAFSAGIEPAPEGPRPEVLATLKALGHDISRLRSKSWDEFREPGAVPMDVVIALCDTVDRLACPALSAARIGAGWPLPDPAKFIGNAAERATLLNELYAALRRRLEAFVALPFAALEDTALGRRIDALGQPLAVG